MLFRASHRFGGRLSPQWTHSLAEGRVRRKHAGHCTSKMTLAARLWGPVFVVALAGDTCFLVPPLGTTRVQ